MSTDTPKDREAMERQAFETWHVPKHGKGYSEWVEAKGRYAWDLTQELCLAFKAGRATQEASIRASESTLQRKLDHQIGVNAELIRANSALREYLRAPAGPVRASEGAEAEANNWIWRHRNGGEYTVLGIGKMQCEVPQGDMSEVTVYRGEDGRLWVRTEKEFAERFTRVRPIAHPPAASEGDNHG